MTHTYSQLVSIRNYAIDTKRMLSNLYGMVQSANIIPSIDAEIVSEIVDDTGVFCDDVIEACSKELHILDARKEKEAAGSIAPRSSRWY